MKNKAYIVATSDNRRSIQFAPTPWRAMDLVEKDGETNFTLRNVGVMIKPGWEKTKAV